MLKEEGRRIEMDLRAVETGGLSIGKRLVRPDMKSGEPCGRPGCVLDLGSRGAGTPHNVQCIQRCLQALWRGGGDGRVLGRVCIFWIFWMWRGRKSPMPSANTWKFSLQRAREAFRTLTSRSNPFTRSPLQDRKRKQ